jgi:cellulose synthase/poly-beta-1,6-N-acetylglucosamine synthase-like glycosyltransferase
VYQENAGPAAARNHGARIAKADLLVFTDSDCVPHPDWLSQLTAGFKSEDVAVVMGGYGISNPKSLLAFCVYKEIVYRHEKLLPNYPKVFGSYNFCVKKKVFERVGGFDVSYRNASGEDNDLSYKITSLGLRIYFERKALVDHYHPTQVKKYLNEQFRHGFWRAKMYTLHPLMAKGDGYTFWKDMIEVPWSLLCIVGFFSFLFQSVILTSLAFCLIWSFLIFEIIFALVMLKNVNKSFSWGFIMFLRAFSRTLGLSTGFWMLLCKKNLNKP